MKDKEKRFRRETKQVVPPGFELEWEKKPEPEKSAEKSKR